MPPNRILIVDDDPAIRRALSRGLRLAGFDTVAASDAGQARAAMAGGPDLLVLDVCLPDAPGTDLCRRLRADGHDLPILILSALDEVADRIAGLQAGADDYLVKPFAFEELELRLRALLRRTPPRSPAAALRCGPLVLDPEARTAALDGRELVLTRREFALLEVLVRNRNTVLSRDQLLDRVWGYDFDVRSDVVDTFVSYLRRKLEADGAARLLHTVRGIGFVLREPAAGTLGEPGR